MIKITNKNSKGFTLSEMMVAVFVFSLSMLAAVSIFSRVVIVQKRTRAVQQIMEDAKYAIELMAKTFRTSDLISYNTTSVEIFDNSQMKCIIYRYDGVTDKINYAEFAAPAGKSSCTPAVFLAMTPLPIVNTGIYEMKFWVVPTVAGSQFGRVTVVAKVCSVPGCAGTDNEQQILQTTVSLRNYEEL